MKIVVTANGAGFDAPSSPIFGRCPVYVFVDTDSMESESVDNPAMNASGGAGIQAAQFVVERGAQAVVSGNLGPNAADVLQAANVPLYFFDGGTVREAVEGYKSGQLSIAGGANVQAHAGMGMGRGKGRHVAGSPAAITPLSASARKQEITELKDMAGGLRKQLAGVMQRLDKLEKGE